MSPTSSSCIVVKLTSTSSSLYFQYGLRQLDLSLLSQLWTLNESIQEFRTIVQEQEALSPPSPSPSNSGSELPSSEDESSFKSTLAQPLPPQSHIKKKMPNRVRTAPPPPPTRNHLSSRWSYSYYIWNSSYRIIKKSDYKLCLNFTFFTTKNIFNSRHLLTIFVYCYVLFTGSMVSNFCVMWISKQNKLVEWRWRVVQ